MPSSSVLPFAYDRNFLLTLPLACPDADYIDELKAEHAEQAKVLGRSVNWVAYAESKLLSPAVRAKLAKGSKTDCALHCFATQQDKGLILDYDKHPVDEQNDLLEEASSTASVPD